MNIETIVVRPLFVNCYFLVDTDKNTVVIDPGGDAKMLARYIIKEELTPLFILNTHGHFDHIGAVADLMEAFDIPFMLHEDDEFLLDKAAESAAAFGMPPVTRPSAVTSLRDGQSIPFGTDNITVIHTPGHSPGGASFHVPSIGALFTGDTLFRESIGRTDFPYANHHALVTSVTERLLTLPGDTTVYPGHGGTSSIAHELRANPFL